jgi:hypothetical protein
MRDREIKTGNTKQENRNTVADALWISGPWSWIPPSETVKRQQLARAMNATRHRRATSCSAESGWYRTLGWCGDRTRWRKKLLRARLKNNPALKASSGNLSGNGGRRNPSSAIQQRGQDANRAVRWPNPKQNPARSRKKTRPAHKDQAERH